MGWLEFTTLPLHLVGWLKFTTLPLHLVGWLKLPEGVVSVARGWDLTTTMVVLTHVDGPSIQKLHSVHIIATLR